MCILPAELVFKILYNSDPRDVVRWRTVSHRFHSIACNDTLWKDLYTNSTLPRPPGPSPSQSRVSLERMLVKSAQLAQSWTTRPMREVSSVNIKLRQSQPTPTKLVSSRWLVGCEEARRFVLHDVDPRAKTHARKVLWEYENPIASAWDAHSMSPVAGQSVVYVLLMLPDIEQGSPKWTLLEFQLNDESGEICGSVTIDPPAWAWSSLSRVEFDGGTSRFLFIPTEDPKGVVFDTRTRAFYAIPPFRVALVRDCLQDTSNAPKMTLFAG
ncbi:hypothetical protein OG21DRAFT_567112 [Imleria badia]|nr:hypothetical protein OG21DRAFT_567112 [Imleria badia]